MNKNTNQTRSKNLSDDMIEKIVGILDGWSGKLTWDSLIEEIELRLKDKYTRQALSKHQRIKSTFGLTKTRLSSETNNDKTTSYESALLMQRAKRLEAENDRLHHENQELLTQFARWAYNAHSRGITIDILNKPLPNVDRGATKI